jgi:membrane-associated protease RseP (regulator of RpoE activity)
MSDPSFVPGDPPPPLPQQVILVRPYRRRYWLHALLLLATVFTTLVVGARLQYNFDHDLPAYSVDTDFFPVAWALSEPSRLWLGLPFSVTLLAFLLAHEMGHFVSCVRNRVFATLPFFIPAPTLIGTLGAFIRVRTRIRSRDALFDIAAAGPFAGFVVAVAAVLLGTLASKSAPLLVALSDVEFGQPLLGQWVWSALASAPVGHLYMHPIALAGWVGMFATALNLIPGGQLDGGHIIYALWPRHHQTITRAVVLILLPMSYFLWAGWLLWAVLLFLSGLRGPQVAVYPELSRGRKLLALALLGIMILTLPSAPLGEHASIRAMIADWRSMQE